MSMGENSKKKKEISIILIILIMVLMICLFGIVHWYEKKIKKEIQQFDEYN